MQMNSLLDTAKDNVRTDLPLDDLMTLYKNYHGALSNTQSDHLQGKNATIDNFSFQIAPNREMQRLSDNTRQALGLTKVKVNNVQTKMNDMQTNWNGYNNVNYVLPNDAQVYIPVNKV